MNVHIINPNNHITSFIEKDIAWFLCYSCLGCFVIQSLICVMWGEALTLTPCKTSSLAVTSSTSLKGHKCFLFSIHTSYVLSVRILTKRANFFSRGKKKRSDRVAWKALGLGNNGTACCDFVILDTHRTPDIPLTIRRHSFCLTNHGSVCKLTLAALERKPRDNLTNMVTSSAKEKGKKAD